MSNVEPAYRFSFYRSSEVWTDSWVEHAAFGKIRYRLGSENGMAMLAHLMRTAGQPDGDIVATEVGRKIPLVQYFESLYRLAEHQTPKISVVSRAKNAPQARGGKLTEAQCLAFDLAAKRPYKWDDVPEKIAKSMVDSGWIILRDDLPRLTDEGRRVYDSCLAEDTRKAA